jgi:hypothetical protein
MKLPVPSHEIPCFPAEQGIRHNPLSAVMKKAPTGIETAQNREN